MQVAIQDGKVCAATALLYLKIVNNILQQWLKTQLFTKTVTIVL